MPRAAPAKSAPPAPQPNRPVPLTPRPRLFTALLIAFVAWMILLLVLYFRT